MINIDMNINMIISGKWRYARPKSVSDQLSYNTFIKCFVLLDIPHVDGLCSMMVVHQHENIDVYVIDESLN